MRYYAFELYTSSKEIEKNATVKLHYYGNDAIFGVNDFFDRKIKNGIVFLVYREEPSTVQAIFAFDEKVENFSNAYAYIMKMLDDAFLVKKVKAEPYEITLQKFIECYMEGKRREYISSGNSFIERANMWLYERLICRSKILCYDFDDRIVSEIERTNKLIYDKSFLNELENIKSHKNMSGYKGNMVHYIIASRSSAATNDMTEILLQNLMQANRIDSKRVDIITNLSSDAHTGQNHFEDILENNHGGTLIIDLSGKFGEKTSNYVMLSKYLEKLFKKYRNKCLFVFTYNMDAPGFSYQILPRLKKYAGFVTLREGTGDRTAAVEYMAELISASEQSKYVDQAGEFLENFPGTNFSQTDVLEAFEQFEPWCINKNVVQAYNLDITKDFVLDRDENVASAYDKLNSMIGLNLVKSQIDNIIAADIVERERKRLSGNEYKSGTMHMVFSGNPGTAKTTVAKLFAGIAKQKGILKSGSFVECIGLDLDGLGCDIRIKNAFVEAQGGVLFVDEAYSLRSSTATTVLLSEMEEHRDDVIVILAGYNERMHEFMEQNEGLRSRIPYWVDFPDYDADELTEIFKLMVHERGFNATDEAIIEAHHIFEKASLIENFGNGRYVRNIIERAIQNQSTRLFDSNIDVNNVKTKELFLITKDDISALHEGLREERPIGTAKKELDEMIGLDSVKEVIYKAIASFKFNKLCIERGLSRDKASLHMVFTGNPGTAKTTVARLFAEIMKDEKVLPTGNFVEVGRAELVGEHVGSTALLVKKRFKEAQGGVLFIDEAYSLCDGHDDSFGDEAINTIVQEMENHREDTIVIFAGYPIPMKKFLDRNPGMTSRIAFQVNFDDYSTDELCEITKLMLSRKQMTITDAAMEKIKRNYEAARETDGFGNGRFVRKTLEEAEMNLAERVLKMICLNESKLSTQLLTTIEESDIPEMLEKKDVQRKQIGF